MPTYQYRCRKCGEEFEKHQSFTDDSIPKCPGCGTRSKANVAKVFSAVGISFKGSGFYKTDHGRSGGSSGGSGGSSGGSDGAGGSDGSSGGSDGAGGSDGSSSSKTSGGDSKVSASSTD